MARHEDLLQDHLLIVKAFERGANHSATDDSVFAMMTPILSNMRSQAQAFMNQSDNMQELLASQDASETEVNFAAFDSGEIQKTISEGYSSNAIPDISGSQESSSAYDKERSTPDVTVGDYLLPEGVERREVPGGKTLADVINECIPCTVRLMSPAELWQRIQAGVSEQLAYQWQMFQRMLEQIKSLLNFFSGDNIMDFCNFLGFFSEFICIPDLRRIIAMLMVMLSRVAFELTNLFDIVVALIGPLLLPFLNVIFGLLQQFLFLIVEPIQCILDSIRAFLGKLDYAALYSSPSGGFVQIGPGGGATEHDVRIGQRGGPITSFLEEKLGTSGGIHKHERADWGLKFNIFTPINKFADITTRDEQEDLKKAEEEYEKLVQEDRNRAQKTEEENARMRDKLAKAKQKVEEARNELNSTEIQQAQQQISRIQDGIRDVMRTIMRFIEEARVIVQSFFDLVRTEIESLLDALLGTGTDGIRLLWDKSMILQIIGFIIALVKALVSGCDDDEGPAGLKADPYKNLKGFIVSEDDNGNITIEEPEEEIANAFQDLGDVVEFTKDPVLDSEIAKAVDQIQTPVKVVRKCQFQTTVSEAEQVNEWIAELNAQ